MTIFHRSLHAISHSDSYNFHLFISCIMIMHICFMWRSRWNCLTRIYKSLYSDWCKKHQLLKYSSKENDDLKEVVNRLEVFITKKYSLHYVIKNFSSGKFTLDDIISLSKFDTIELDFFPNIANYPIFVKKNAPVCVKLSEQRFNS